MKYNKEQNYFDLFWKSKRNKDLFFHLRVGESLFKPNGDSHLLVVWARFKHPHFKARGLVEFIVYDQSDVEQLILECRIAIINL